MSGDDASGDIEAELCVKECVDLQSAEMKLSLNKNASVGHLVGLALGVRIMCR
jgi:hypothetical protein